MSPRDQLFNQSYAQELYRLAHEDLLSGEFLATSPKIRRENILFHIEQAVEKSLKALLCHHGLPIPMVYDIYTLLRRLPDGEWPPHGDSLNDLTPYATIRRYEEGKAIISDEDLAFAIKSAESTLDWVKSRLVDNA